jgi:hypothetical protein
VLWSSAPDCARCTRPYNSKLFSFGFLKRRSAIIHRTVRCTSGATALQRNGRLHSALITLQFAAEVRGAPNNEQCMSGAPIDDSLPQWLNWWLRAINPPNHLDSNHSLLLIQYKSNRLHSKDTIQVIDPLKVSNSTLAHLDLWDDHLCFFVALVCLAWLSFLSHFLLSSAL